MESELTLGDLYEEISDRLAAARTKALMGERQEAMGLFRGASLDFTRFREVLHDYPGFYALEHAFTITLQHLGAEEELTSNAQREHSGMGRATDTKRATGSKRRTASKRKAA